MKNIQFRAFDKKEQKLCRVSVINFDLGCFLEGNSPTSDTYTEDMIIEGIKTGHFVNFEDLELMQYTKCDDVDGNNLFNNDIIDYYNVLYIIIDEHVYDLESYLDDDYDGKFGHNHGDRLDDLKYHQIKLISNKYEYNK